MSDNAAQPLEDMLKLMDSRQIRKTMRGAYGAEARKVVKIARSHLASKSIEVRGSQADWAKGIRPYVYSGIGGFMVTVKGIKGKSMHVNRNLDKKPILMWAEDGTKRRHTKTATRVWTRKRKRHYTGSMPAIHVLAETEEAMRSNVETDIGAELEKKAIKIIKKSGLDING